MLSYYQVEIVAYQTDGAIICPDCARGRYGELTLAKADAGMTTSYVVDPLSRYSMDTLIGDISADWASQEHEDGTPEWDAAYEAMCEAGYPCDGCYESII